MSKLGNIYVTATVPIGFTISTPTFSSQLQKRYNIIETRGRQIEQLKLVFLQLFNNAPKIVSTSLPVEEQGDFLKSCKTMCS